MNDKEISIELLKIYPEYKDEYTFLEFLNLFNAVRRFIPNKRRQATYLHKGVKRSNSEEERKPAVFIDSELYIYS